MAGLFPRPTFKDKSTYVESSTKVYDDVSVPHTGPWGRFPSLPGVPGDGQWVGGAVHHLLTDRPTLYGLSHPLVSPTCHVYYLAESKVPRATWKFPQASLLDQVWAGEDAERLPGGAQGAGSQPHPLPHRWRFGTCPGSSSHCWAAMPSIASCTWSTRAGTPGCSACSMASC